MILNNQKDEVTGRLGEYEYEGRRLVISYSSKQAAKDKADRERLVNRLKKKLKPCHTKEIPDSPILTLMP